MPGEHAKLSPSSMKRICECPGSFALYTKHSPKEDYSPFAAEGTKAHEVGETCLLTGKDAKDVVNDEEMIKYVQQYVDYCREIAERNGGHMLVEQKFDLSHFIPESFGTADFVSLSPDGWLDIGDLKYGKGVKVYADKNVQLMCYALGAVEALKDQIEDFKGVRAHICQPRLDHFDTWTVDWLELESWREYIHERAMIAWNITYEYKQGKHCQFCKAKPYCPDKIREAEEELFSAMLFAEKDLPALLEKAERIEEWVKAVRKEAETVVTEGKEVNGFGFREGRRKRVWRKDVDQEKLISILTTSTSIKEEELYEKSFLSVPKLEKVLKTMYDKTFAKELIEELSETEEGNPVFGRIKTDGDTEE